MAAGDAVRVWPGLALFCMTQKSSMIIITPFLEKAYRFFPPVEIGFVLHNPVPLVVTA
jgi:hypothetical protein